MTQSYACEPRLPYAYTPPEKGWTPTRVELLKKLWGEGHSCSQIAKQLRHTTRNAVIGKIHRMGLALRATPTKTYKKSAQRRRPRPMVERAPRFNPTPTPMLHGERERIAKLAPIDSTLGLDKLNQFTCRYPIGDPLEQGFAFCGRTCEGPYCRDHHKLCYTPADGRREAGLKRLATFLDTGVLRSRAA